jgi:cell wall-associated NlpC family hydrolase
MSLSCLFRLFRLLGLMGLLLALWACSAIPSGPAGTSGTSGGIVSSPQSDAQAVLSEDQSQGVTMYALGLVGTPYRYGGNTPESGFDCSGLIGHVYRTQAGLTAPRTVSSLQAWGREVLPAQRRSGDVVLFGAGREPTHAGIYVGSGRFVHAPSTGGKVRLDPLESGYWARQQVAYRRP